MHFCASSGGSRDWLIRRWADELGGQLFYHITAYSDNPVVVITDPLRILNRRAELGASLLEIVRK